MRASVLLAGILAAVSFSVSQAHARPVINQIRCVKPGTSTVVTKLDRIQNASEPAYTYEVSMAGDGKAFTERSVLTITEAKKGILYFEVSKNADADSFSLDTKTGEGWISLIEFNSIPFEFSAKCEFN